MRQSCDKPQTTSSFVYLYVYTNLPLCYGRGIGGVKCYVLIWLFFVKATKLYVTQAVSLIFCSLIGERALCSPSSIKGWRGGLLSHTKKQMWRLEKMSISGYSQKVNSVAPNMYAITVILCSIFFR